MKSHAAWFYAEPSRAKKHVQEDQKNLRWTELDVGGGRGVYLALIGTISGIMCHVHLYIYIYIDTSVSHYLKLVHHKKCCVKGHYRYYNLLHWRCSYSSRIYMLGVRS